MKFQLKVIKFINESSSYFINEMVDGTLNKACMSY